MGKSLYEKDELIVASREYAQYANDKSGYINLMKLFEHQNQMFIDSDHYTDKGHEMIANKVYEAIQRVIHDLR